MLASWRALWAVECVYKSCISLMLIECRSLQICFHSYSCVLHIRLSSFHRYVPSPYIPSEDESSGNMPHSYGYPFSMLFIMHPSMLHCLVHTGTGRDRWAALIDYLLNRTEEVNIDLLQDISTDGTSPSSSLSPSSSPLSLSARNNLPSNANHPLPLTRENLSEHCRQFDGHGSNQGDTSQPGDDGEPCGLVDKMTTGTKLKSMTPMERFLAEENDGYEPPMDEDDKSMNAAHAWIELDEDQPDSGEILMPARDESYESGGFGHWSACL